MLPSSTVIGAVEDQSQLLFPFFFNHVTIHTEISLSLGKEEKHKGDRVLITELEGMYACTEQYCMLGQILVNSLTFPSPRSTYFDRFDWSSKRA